MFASRQTRACRPRRATSVTAAVLACVCIGACDSQPATVAKAGGTAEPGSGFAVSYRFSHVPGTSGEISAVGAEMLTDGGAHVRVTVDAGSDSQVLVSDGDRTVDIRQDDGSFENDKVVMPAFVIHQGDHTLAAWCAAAKEAGVVSVLKRPATHYRCTGRGTGWSRHLSALWVDKATGLILEWDEGGIRATATKIDTHPTLPADAFSLQPAPGAEDRAHPAVKAFQVPRVGGGQVTWSDYRDKSAVIIVGKARGIRSTLQRLEPMQGSNGSLQLVGLLRTEIPSDWQGSLLNPADAAALARSVSASVGSFPAPVGIDIKGGVGRSITSTLYSRRNRTRIVLVRRDGTIERVTDDLASDADLRAAIGKLG